jgi:hypothetical protein
MLGHTAKKLEELLFDWLVYGAVTAYLTSLYGVFQGSLWTFAVMAPLSALMCYLYLKFYDWSKRDWLGLEALKRLREGKGLFARLAKLGNVPAFVVLSLQFDPFVVTVYLRKGSDKYNGYSGRDWMIFWASVLFANAYWTLRWTLIFELIRLLWAKT